MIATEITLKVSKDIDFDQLSALYRQVGLVAGYGKAGNTEAIREAFLNSYKIVTAYAGNRLVGAGRMLSDGICYATIFDVGIHPDFQKKGIGKKIMLALLDNTGHLKVHLTSTFGNELFYEKLGFKRHKTAFAKYPCSSEYLIDPDELDSPQRSQNEF